MDVFYHFQRRVAIRSDRLEAVCADAFGFRCAREIWILTGGLLTAHTAPSTARREQFRL
jgi:hypothetical protein